MPAGKYDLILEIGSQSPEVWTWKDGSDVVVNNTGMTAKLQIKRDFNSTENLLELTEASGITLGGANGKITIVVTPAQIDALKARKAELFYTMTMISSGSIPTRILEGRVYIR